MQYQVGLKGRQFNCITGRALQDWFDDIVQQPDKELFERVLNIRQTNNVSTVVSTQSQTVGNFDTSG